MADTAAPAGVSLTTALQTIYQHPSAAGTPNAIGRIRIVNSDGAADVNLTAFNFVKAAAPGTKHPILPVNAKLAKLDAIELDKVFEPGDMIEGSASAAGDAYVTVDIFKEPTP